jgi:chaperonin cofactor prefoldin
MLVGFGALGAIIVVIALIAMRAGSAPKDEPIAATAQTAIQVAAKPATEAIETVKKAVEDPNLIKVAEKVGENMIPMSVADRYKDRASAAEKKAKQLEKQIIALNGRIAQLTSEKEALIRSQLPPPPAQADEVLQMLEPVLAGRAR